MYIIGKKIRPASWFACWFACWFASQQANQLAGSVARRFVCPARRASTVRPRVAIALFPDRAFAQQFGAQLATHE